MVAPRGLVVVVVVLHKVGRVFRQGIDNTPAEPVFSGLQISQALGAHGSALGITCFFTVFGIEIALGVHTSHVVHGRDHRRLDAGVQRCGVQGHAAPAADADDADTGRINSVAQGEEIHRSHEVLGIDVGGSHIAHVAAALAGEGRVKGNRQKATLCHGLRVKAGALLLDCAEGAANGDRRKSALRVFRRIHVSRQRDPITIDKAYLAVVHFFALREGFVPLLRQLQIIDFHHNARSPSLICARSGACRLRQCFP